MAAQPLSPLQRKKPSPEPIAPVKSKRRREANPVSVNPLPTRKTAPRIVLEGIIAAGFEAPTTGKAAPQGSLQLDLTSLGMSLKPSAFAMQVQGDSMRDAHIQDGDIVLLEPGRPRSGDIVAAALNGCLLLKRFTVVKRVPYLEAENTAQPGRVRAVDKPIHGVLRGLLRLRPGPPPDSRHGETPVAYPLPRATRHEKKASARKDQSKAR